MAWVKNYTALLSDPDYHDLTYPQRGVLHGVWLLSGVRAKPLRYCSKFVGRALGQPSPHVANALRVLLSNNFIELCGATENLHSELPRLEESRVEDIEREDKKPPISPFENLAFKEFWEGHPRQRRGSKEKSYAAWKRALLRSPANEILAGHRDYIKSDEVRDGFAKGAAAWLNDDRWKSDYRTFRTKTTEEMREEFINGDQGSSLGRDSIDGECVEVPEGGFGRGSGGLPVGIEGTIGRPGEDGGNGLAGGVVESGAAQASGHLEDSERTKAAVQDLAKIAAKRTKP